jgi:hypothetical protein
MKQKPLLVRLDCPAIYDHVHQSPLAECVRRIEGPGPSFYNLQNYFTPDTRLTGTSECDTNNGVIPVSVAWFLSTVRDLAATGSDLFPPG